MGIVMQPSCNVHNFCVHIFQNSFNICISIFSKKFKCALLAQRELGERKQETIEPNRDERSQQPLVGRAHYNQGYNKDCFFHTSRGIGAPYKGAPHRCEK